MNVPLPQSQKPWYKTGGGIVFLGILAMIALGGLLFAALIGYYVYQIRQGNGDQIAEQISKANTNFSTVAGTENGTTTTGQDPTPFIRPYNPQLGDPRSPVIIMAFIDFECPYCQEAYTTFETIRATYGTDTHIVFKHFPLPSIHPLATRAALAASCAEEQDRFWEYYQVLFKSKALSKENLLQSATTVGMNTQLFTTCLESERYRAQIEQDIRDGQALGVRGTPTYFVGTKKLEGVISLDTWNDEIVSRIQQQ